MGYNGYRYRFSQQKAHKAIDNTAAMVARLRSFALALLASGADQEEVIVIEHAASILEKHMNFASGINFNRTGGEC